MSKSNEEEPSTAPQPERWYNLELGPSFKDRQPASKFCTLRYEFKPASIDKSQPGSLHKKDNRVTVEFQNNQQGKPKVKFEGMSEDYKENDAILFFDGQTFQLERLHRAVKRLRHVRLPGESMVAATSASTASVGAAAGSNSPAPDKGTKVQSLNKGVVHQAGVERIDVGNSEISGAKANEEKDRDYPPSNPNPSSASPDPKDSEQEEHVDIVNDDDDDDDGGDCGPQKENLRNPELNTGLDINLPHPAEMDDEIAEVDVSDDETDKGPNAAEALRAQVNAEAREEQTSSMSSSSGSDSSGSGSGSGSRSGSGSSSSDSESSDADSVNSI